MKIKIIDEKNLWQKFFDDNCLSSFLHSWEWGEFQQSLGYPIIRLGLFNNKNQLEAICLVIKIKSRRGSFLFIPHGPIFNQNKNEKIKIKNYIEKIKNYLITLSKKENYWFIRMAPVLEDKEEYQKIFSDLGFKKAPIYMHAETTWELPLINKTEEELLSSMRKTTRYLIKKATRDGVLIEKTEDPKALKIFYNLYQETAKREKFTPFSFDFLKKEFAAFSKSKKAMIFLAKAPKAITGVEVEGILPTRNAIFEKIKNNLKTGGTDGRDPTSAQRFFQPDAGREHLWEGNRGQDPFLAAALIFFTKSAAFYHQGACLHTKIPATYLLQWEAIKEAKNRGCLIYNFWGIYDEQRPERTPKSWQGLTLFKTGFSGQIKRFLETQDYIISKKYYLTYLWEKFLMWKRLIK
jgi:lipid II:glycine glycyltransferase (peptidoglycan interpeptide bridge formation enzyme)